MPTLISVARKRAGSYISKAITKKAKSVASSLVRRAGRRISRRIRKIPRISRAISAYRNLTGKQKSHNNVRLTGTGFVAPNVLAQLELLNIDQGTGPGQRENNSIFLKGIQFQWNFFNPGTAYYYVNFAMCTPKNRLDVVNDNFFRSNTTENNISFTDTSLTAFNKHTRALNADWLVIHWHKRFLLGPSASANGSKHRDKKFKFWYPINSRVTYSERVAGGPEKADNGLFVLVWYNIMGAQVNAGQMTPAPSGALQMTQEYDMRVVFNGE